MSLKINKELLIGLIQDWRSDKRYKVVFQEVDGIGRWSIYYMCVIRDESTGKFYDASYSEGSTEMQDEQPFDDLYADADGNVELLEVEPYQVTMTKYRDKTNDRLD